MPEFVSRIKDERLLLWLEARRSGLSTRQIARAAGCSPENVQMLTNRVRKDDLALSGEDPDEVKGHYWK